LKKNKEAATSKKDQSTHNKKTLDWNDPKLRKRRKAEFKEAERLLQEQAYREGWSNEQYWKRRAELYDDTINQDFYRYLARKGIKFY
jgi:hypothetical protein